jgi:hypothetical protein
MALNCEQSVNEELKRLRDIQRCLETLVLMLGVNPAGIGLEDCLTFSSNGG